MTRMKPSMQMVVLMMRQMLMRDQVRLSSARIEIKMILDDSDDYSSIDESDSASEEELGSSEESGKDWDELEAEAMRDDKNKERDVSFCYIFKTHPTSLTIFSVTNAETETEEAMEAARNENMEGEACQVQRNKDDKMF